MLFLLLSDINNSYMWFSGEIGAVKILEGGIGTFGMEISYLSSGLTLLHILVI